MKYLTILFVVLFLGCSRGNSFEIGNTVACYEEHYFNDKGTVQAIDGSNYYILFFNHPGVGVWMPESLLKPYSPKWDSEAKQETNQKANTSGVVTQSQADLLYTILGCCGFVLVIVLLLMSTSLKGVNECISEIKERYYKLISKEEDRYNELKDSIEAKANRTRDLERNDIDKAKSINELFDQIKAQQIFAYTLLKHLGLKYNLPKTAREMACIERYGISDPLRGTDATEATLEKIPKVAK